MHERAWLKDIYDVDVRILSSLQVCRSRKRSTFINSCVFCYFIPENVGEGCVRDTRLGTLTRTAADFDGQLQECCI